MAWSDARCLLDEPQPTVALWTRSGEPAVRVDQGPDSIYGAAGIPHGYGFPAAYLWRDGFEAAVFFDMTSARWMQRDGVARFHDARIMTSRRDSGGVGLGMHSKKLSGRTIPADDMQVDFHLFQGVRHDKPSALQGLATMLRVFAPLHPSAAQCPRDQLTGRPASWHDVAAHTMADLMKPETIARPVGRHGFPAASQYAWVRFAKEPRAVAEKPLTLPRTRS